MKIKEKRYLYLVQESVEKRHAVCCSGKVQKSYFMMGMISWTEKRSCQRSRNPGMAVCRFFLVHLRTKKMAQLLKTLDLVVMSPGVPTDLPIVNEMRDRGISIWGEIELAYEAGKGEVLAITGTNGKTTTTSLLGQIMKNYTENTYVVGNIGNPYTSVALETTEDSVIVAEMSSFTA